VTLGKNAAAKIAALVASAAALVGTWALVHQNPPPPAAADAPAATQTVAGQNGTAARPSRARQRVSLTAPRPRTRTHAS
jgi:hypothetical protein